MDMDFSIDPPVEASSVDFGELSKTLMCIALESRSKLSIGLQKSVSLTARDRDVDIYVTLP